VATPSRPSVPRQRPIPLRAAGAGAAELGEARPLLGMKLAESHGKAMGKW